VNEHDAFLEPDVDEEEIPVIEASMLQPTVDFEAGMGWFPPVTSVLIAACIVVFGFEIATGALQNLNRLIEMGALEAAQVAKGEVWRLLSCEFLHGGADHLIGNMLMLYILGLACEHGFGRSQFLFLYVAAAVGASAVSLIDAKTSVGASGAIFGLAGALIALFRRQKHVLRVRDHRIGFVVGIWAIYTIAMGFINPHIDNMAHMGGFIIGMLLGSCLPSVLIHDRDEFGRRFSTVMLLATACVMIAATSLFFVPRLSG